MISQAFRNFDMDAVLKNRLIDAAASLATRLRNEPICIVAIRVHSHAKNKNKSFCRRISALKTEKTHRNLEIQSICKKLPFIFPIYFSSWSCFEPSETFKEWMKDKQI